MDNFILIIALIVIVALCVGFFHDFTTVLDQAKQTTERTVELESIAVSSQLVGRFTLGCGSINGREYYVCYQKNEDGSLQLIKLEARITRIYQTLKDGDIAYAIIEENGWGTVKAVQLYVPENTVQVEYDLSLSQNNSGGTPVEPVETTKTEGDGNNCTNCGAEIYDTPYCAQCGAPSRTEIEPSTSVCPGCGAECDTPFCGACGTAMPEE